MTFENIINAMDKDEVFEVQSGRGVVPGGHWIAKAKCRGINRYYLLKGLIFDPQSHIVGRLEKSDNSSGWYLFIGPEVFGGVFEFAKDFYDGVEFLASTSHLVSSNKLMKK